MQTHVPEPGAWLYVEEITHRALNDYTAMLAIVRRAAMTVSDESSGQALGEVAHRLGAAATAFRALRRPQEGQWRNLDEELKTLCIALSESVLAGKDVRIKLVSEPVTIGAHRCWQVSLAVFELVTNAVRHAFRKQGGGSVTVELGLRGRNIQCAVIDDGTAEPFAAPGRGTSIVNALVAELGGTVTRHHTGSGSAILLCMPLDDEGERIEQ